MFGFDWPELIIIGIVALIFIGPEDLPDMFRQLGRFTAKLRQMSREFSRAMEQAAKDTGVSDVARDLKTSTSTKSLGLDKVREAADKFEKWDPMKNTANPTPTMPARSLTPPPMPATPPTVVAAAVESAPVVPEVTITEAAIAEEMDDDLAVIAEHEEFEAARAAAPAAGLVEPARGPVPDPAKEAFYDKLALRSQVLKEQTEKLKAIEAGTYMPEPAAISEPAAPVQAEDEAKPAPKRTAKAKVAAQKSDAAAADAAEAAPRKSPRKKKADNA